jgi:hypothetical protein
MGPVGCSETSVENYDSTLRKIPEENTFQNSSLFYSAKIFYILSLSCLGTLRLLRFPLVQSKMALSSTINRHEDLSSFPPAVFLVLLSKSRHSKDAILSCLLAVTHAFSQLEKWCCMLQEQAIEAMDVIKSGHISH